MTTATALKPGVYTDLPATDYHLLDALGSSTLADMRRSMAYARSRMQAMDESTAAQKSGSLVHALVLEPDTVASRFCAAGTCEALLKSGPRKGHPCGLSGSWYEVEDNHARAYCGKHVPDGAVPDDRTVLKASEWDDAAAIAQAVLHDAAAADLLSADGAQTEVTLVWEDEATGILCKARPDVLAGSLTSIADLKRNRNAHPDRWPGECWRRGYYIQAAHYLAGARSLGIPVERWFWILVEPEAPHELWVPECDEETVLAGQRERSDLLGRWQACVETGWFPGYPGGKGQRTGIPESARAGVEGQAVNFGALEVESEEEV